MAAQPITHPNATTGPIARAAMWYAAQLGWPVLPVHSIDAGACSCRRPDCGSPGKHPLTPHGLKDATLDAASIEGWWARWPNANVAIATGVVSGIVVLDIDPRHGGDESLAELIRTEGPLPETVVADSGGGGAHFIFRHPGGQIANRSNIRPGLDVRGDGGYIVAAPSTHIAGATYRWRQGCGPHERVPAPLPPWLLTILAPESPRAAEPMRPRLDRATSCSSVRRASISASVSGCLAACGERRATSSSHWARLLISQFSRFMGYCGNRLYCSPARRRQEIQLTQLDVAIAR